MLPQSSVVTWIEFLKSLTAGIERRVFLCEMCLLPFQTETDKRFDWLESHFLQYFEQWKHSIASCGDFSREDRDRMMPWRRQKKTEIECSCQHKQMKLEVECSCQHTQMKVVK